MKVSKVQIKQYQDLKEGFHWSKTVIDKCEDINEANQYEPILRIPLTFRLGEKFTPDYDGFQGPFPADLGRAESRC